MSFGILYDDIFLEHRPIYSHPERPERLLAIKKELERSGIWGRAKIYKAREATKEELLYIHTEWYVDMVLAILSRRGEGNFDPDTYYSSKTKEAALGAVGGVIDLMKAVLRGEIEFGFALPRPPGHHAEAERAMGFCIFNNVAIGAMALIKEGLKRILIFDWDVHHGNATQHSFETSNNVFYISVHQWPHYPGTGLNHEVGRGEGEGYTINIPYPGGATDEDYAAVIDRVVEPVAEKFKPEFIIISAGFDAHKADMLSGMEVTENGFAYMGYKLYEIAKRVANGKIVFVLEGGYDLNALANSVRDIILAVEGNLIPKHPPAQSSSYHIQSLEKTLSYVKKYWDI